jgi:murein L,D-transpeptidase YcbB/YkuD
VEDGQVQHEMPVIIGKASRKTKDFTSQITAIRLNPTWTAPLSIKMRDILPKVKEDPNYLVNKQIQVKRTVDGRREILDPHTIDWESMTWKSMNEISMVQKPGRKNALGSYRVLMPNRYDIYFHDTNQPSLFDRGQRTLSSGCVRMSEPEKIAAFILGGKEGWSEADTDRVLRSGRKTDILIDESFPSYIVYQSMWLDHKGALVYGPDFYKRDDQLIAALTSTDDFYVPETTKPARFAGLNR